jgi:hypothetical protein
VTFKLVAIQNCDISKKKVKWVAHEKRGKRREEKKIKKETT